MSSEGAKQFRHKFIYPDVLIFTNLAPEHIESHGSYEKYFQAKLAIAKELENKKGKTIIANMDDKEGEKFLELNIKNKIPYSLRDAIAVKADFRGSSFQMGKMIIHSKLPGIFNVYNMLGAIAYAKFAGISDEAIKKGLESINFVRGRMEKIDCGQNFDVVVDYAHTPDSLRAVYQTYNSCKKICVLGNTGGGRDTWKRPEMGKIADEYCDQIILTDEDPYDEDPMKIVGDIKKGIKKKPVEIIMDRRRAINKAIQNALITKQTSGDKYKVAVLITGKGTDPYIMGPNGTKQEWDDATVVREELNKILKK
jgi:UDP-N-acetylmuramoyl-L-alanyl-D-glutamate--2,6-diaminopimelate ligase